MAYDKEKASPSEEAHKAAAALDFAVEAVADGVQVTDLSALFKLQDFLNYVIVPDKGKMVSRLIQVGSLVERDNQFLDNAIDAPVA